MEVGIYLFHFKTNVIVQSFSLRIESFRFILRTLKCLLIVNLIKIPNFCPVQVPLSRTEERRRSVPASLCDHVVS